MSKRVRWREKAVDVDAAETDTVVATPRSFDIDKSQTTACTICPEAEHKMQYRLLVCSYQSCSEASVLKFASRGNIVTCLETEHALFFEYGDHNTVVSSPKRKKLASAQKAFCRDLAGNHLRPRQRLHAQSQCRTMHAMHSLKQSNTIFFHSRCDRLDRHNIRSSGFHTKPRLCRRKKMQNFRNEC
ncbi:hypothetical protein PI125_g18227 [Phytophthora idaei]|nr:hypothetical protein PI125_g18227 [Phytophthora idaei]